MPKISNLPIDQNIDKGDKLLGSDVGGGTRNYRIEDISSFLRNANLIGAVGQISYIFYNESFGGNSIRPSGSITIDSGDTSFPYSTVTTIKASKFGYAGSKSIENILEGFAGKQVILSASEDPNAFGVFNCTSVVQDTIETDFYNIALEYLDGSGSLTDKEYYSIVLYQGQSATAPTLDTVTDSGNTTTNTVDVGGVTTDYVQLDTAAAPTLQPGMFGWNDAFGTADLRLKGDNVTLQIGQEFVARVVNKTGADLLESEYKVVRVRIASEGGAQGQRLAVVLAQGDNDPDSVTTLGIVTEDILNNEEGFVTILGNISGIDTTGTLQGETWVDGDVLYLSPTTPGALTKVKPTAPDHTVTMGYVVYAHQNQGKIFVKVDNGYEIDELHNVLISNPQDEDILLYNSALAIWENTPLATAVPTPTLQTVTDAGNTTTNSITVSELTATERVSLEADSTATTQTTAVIQATDTNSGIAIVPNGTGAITAQVPDGTATGGNARGNYSVDLQRVRSLNTQVATGSRSIILNGERNRTTAENSIVGGYQNFTSGQNSVALGFGNTASGLSSFAVNNSNSVSRNHGFVAGWSNNIQSTGDSSSITGGNQNVVQTDKAHIGGGLSNSINYTGTNGYEVISGGRSNTASISYSTVSGGQSNTVSTNTHATVVGGYQNSSTGQYSVSGGYSNVASGQGAVALGYDNTASGDRSVAMGGNSVASDNKAVAIGSSNNASQPNTIAIGVGNTVSNLGSTAIGQNNTITGKYSSSIGFRSYAYIYGQFSYANGFFSAVGDAQQSYLTSRKQDTLTTGATTTLSLDGTGTTNLIIPDGNNRVWNVKVETVAVVTSITGTADGVSVGDSLLQNDIILFSKIGGTSSVVGTNNTQFISSTSLSTALMEYSAGASQELALTFTAPTFTGGGSVTMRVVSKVSLVEVAY